MWEARGVGTFEGPTALRGFWEDWVGAYEELGFEVEQVLEVGGGVVFAVIRQQGRPIGSAGSAEWRGAYVYECVDGLVVRVGMYTDIDEARVAAERFAEPAR